jgi:hypothetical protein
MLMRLERMIEGWAFEGGLIRMSEDEKEGSEAKGRGMDMDVGKAEDFIDGITLKGD